MEMGARPRADDPRFQREAAAAEETAGAGAGGRGRGREGRGRSGCSRGSAGSSGGQGAVAAREEGPSSPRSPQRRSHATRPFSCKSAHAFARTCSPAASTAASTSASAQRLRWPAANAPHPKHQSKPRGAGARLPSPRHRGWSLEKVRGCETRRDPAPRGSQGHRLIRGVSSCQPAVGGQSPRRSRQGRQCTPAFRSRHPSPTPRRPASRGRRPGRLRGQASAPDLPPGAGGGQRRAEPRPRCAADPPAGGKPQGRKTSQTCPLLRPPALKERLRSAVFNLFRLAALTNH